MKYEPYRKTFLKKLQILMSYLLYTSYKSFVVQCTGIEETGLSLFVRWDMFKATRNDSDAGRL
jgi:hypothetical protein